MLDRKVSALSEGCCRLHVGTIISVEGPQTLHGISLGPSSIVFKTIGDWDSNRVYSRLFLSLLWFVEVIMVPPSPPFSLVARPHGSARLSSRSSTSSSFSRASTISRASTLSNASFSSSFSHISQASNPSTCSSSITSFVDFTDPFEFSIAEDEDEDDEKSNYEKSLPPTPTSPTTEVGPKSISEVLEKNAESSFLDTHSPHLNLLVPWIRISVTSSGHASIFLLTASDPQTLDSQSIRLSLTSDSLISTVPKVIYEEKRLKGSGPPSWEEKRVFDLQAEPGKTVSNIVNVVRATRGVQWDGEYVGPGDRSKGGRARCKSWVADALVELQGRNVLHQRSVVCARTVGCTLANDKGSAGVCC